MIISKSKNFIYIHLEKCGGTSIEIALEPYLAWDDIILGSTDFGTSIQVAHMRRAQKNPNQEAPLFKHSNAHEIKKYLGSEYDSMYKFVTVREPVDLMYSLYFYAKKIVDNFLINENIQDLTEWAVTSLPNLWKKEVYLLNYVISEISGGGIDLFVKKMIKSNHSSVTPQLYRVDESVELFDIKNINERWLEILEKLNITDAIILEKENKSKRYDTIVMNKESIDLIKKHFSVDYEWIPSKTGVDW